MGKIVSNLWMAFVILMSVWLIASMYQILLEVGMEYLDYNFFVILSKFTTK